MSVFQKNATCPYCHKSSMVELQSAGAMVGLQKVRCSHCRKSWEQDFSEGAGNLQKSAPAASTESLADLRRSINRQFDELTELVTELVKKRMTFQPQQTGEHLPAGVDGIPVRKDIGDNAARDPKNIRKAAGAFGQDLQDSGKNRFAPQNVRKIDAENAQAVDLLKAARENRKPPHMHRPG